MVPKYYEITSGLRERRMLVEILEFGNQDNKSIILIHGFQCPYQMWNQYIEYYKDKYHIIVPILEGHNPKKRENFMSLQQTATEIED